MRLEADPGDRGIVGHREAGAEALAAAGATVILVARREHALNAVAARIAARGGTAITLPADLADMDAVDAVASAAGPVDILINNTARSIRRPWRLAPVDRLSLPSDKRPPSRHLDYERGTERQGSCPPRSMLNKRSEHVKVAFELASSEVDGYPPAAVEHIWTTPVGSGRYAVENIPFYAFGVSRGDVVEAEEVDGSLTFRRVVERSMHSVFRVFVSDEKETESIRALFAAKGVKSELADVPLITLDVPPEADLESIVAMLEEGWASDRWGYEEGNVPP